MKLLLDSDIIISLVKSDDLNHGRALNFFKKNKKQELFVSPFVVSEVATILSYRVSQDAAAKFLKNIRSRAINQLPISFETIRLADRIFLKQTKKGTSWVDCLNVGLIEVFELDGIVSFDKFYQSFEFRVLP